MVFLSPCFLKDIRYFDQDMDLYLYLYFGLITVQKVRLKGYGSYTQLSIDEQFKWQTNWHEYISVLFFKLLLVFFPTWLYTLGEDSKQWFNYF